MRAEVREEAPRRASVAVVVKVERERDESRPRREDSERESRDEEGRWRLYRHNKRVRRLIRWSSVEAPGFVLAVFWGFSLWRGVGMGEQVDADHWYRWAGRLDRSEGRSFDSQEVARDGTAVVVIRPSIVMYADLGASAQARCI